MPLGRLHKRILCKWLLYDGEETQKSWKPMLNTIFALRGSSECSVQPIAKQVLRHNFFVPSAKRHCRTDLLTPEPSIEISNLFLPKKTAIHSGMAILSTENYKIHRFIKMFRAMESIALCHLTNYAAGLRFLYPDFICHQTQQKEKPKEIIM